MAFLKKWNDKPLSNRLLAFILGLLLFSCLVVGIPSYWIAKEELNKKGETILKNSVEMALQLIDAKNTEVEKGTLSLEEAQEQVKQYLLGQKNSDGTRNIDSSIDLGENGYFIVYSLEGDEIMHPTLEGDNVWWVLDKGAQPFYLVQDQISKGSRGGGFSYYTWNLPGSEEMGSKVSYAKLDSHWNWVVTATSYMKAYNQGAKGIMAVMLTASMMLLLLGGYISISFVKGITTPIQKVLEGMKDAEAGTFRDLDISHRADELGSLINGYNSMVGAVNHAYEDLLSQEQKAHYYAYYDSISGLPNENLFREQVAMRMALKPENGYLILVSIKDYEFINSYYGSAYGEKIIELLGSALGKFQEDSQMVARYTVNEFAGWVENWSQNQILENMKRLREFLYKTLAEQGYAKLLTFHISYAEFPKQGVNYDICFQKAAIAMQYAREHDLEESIGFEDFMYDQLERESSIRSLAEVAMMEDQFQLYYQEKVDLRNKKVSGVEALARWHSGTLGWISPGDFIPVFNKSNLMIPFSIYILNKALDEFPKICDKYGNTVTLSINISPIFFFRDDFVALVQTAISERGINPAQIVLEITEDIFIESLELIQEKANELRTFGVKISLDDFGTGYSSLNYLTSIHFDEIKIDKSFIDFLLKDEKAFSLFKLIVDIANTFNYDVVAEGVETQEQVDFIHAVGCHLIQGYIFSRPEPLNT